MVNLEDIPRIIKDDVEDRSLEILERISEKIVVIGGWGVRAHLGTGHLRYTLDVDGVCDQTRLAEIREELLSMNLRERKIDWGVQFFKAYEPPPDVSRAAREAAGMIQLRIELSAPRIEEKDTHHYFEFDLEDYVVKEMEFHSGNRSIKIKVPPIEHMTAVKLGLPVDYKNNYDAAMLLERSRIERVIQIIQDNDDWSSLVLRRMPKLKGRMRRKGGLENVLAKAAGLDIGRHLERLDHIEDALRQ